MMTKEDVDDIQNRLPFVLTTDEIPDYQILYVGQQQEDELHTYVFDIAPKTIEKGKRYFQGRIWVDDHDFQIVKTKGKSVPAIRKKNEENLFPDFSTGDVHIRQIVKYSNYKRFGSDVKITYEGKEVETKPVDGQKPQTKPPE